MRVQGCPVAVNGDESRQEHWNDLGSDGQSAELGASTRMPRARRPASEHPGTGGGDNLVDRVSAGRVVVVHFGREERCSTRSWWPTAARSKSGPSGRPANSVAAPWRYSPRKTATRNTASRRMSPTRSANPVTRWRPTSTSTASSRSPSTAAPRRSTPGMASSARIPIFAAACADAGLVFVGAERPHDPAGRQQGASH